MKAGSSRSRLTELWLESGEPNGLLQRVRLLGGRLLYEAWRGDEPVERQEVEPSEEAWDAFWHVLDEVNAWQFGSIDDEFYPDPRGYEFRITYGPRRMDASGDGWQAGMPAFYEAVRRLISKDFGGVDAPPDVL